jgi:transcriptional regulator with AAA-type ATPase domain
MSVSHLTDQVPFNDHFFRLIDCGHTFCRQCLVIWFNVTLTQQRTNLPGNLGELPFMIKYGCPSCRTEVTRIPIENYAIKSVTNAVGVVDDAEAQTGNSVGDYYPLAQLLEHLV